MCHIDAVTRLIILNKKTSPLKAFSIKQLCMSELSMSVVFLQTAGAVTVLATCKSIALKYGHEHGMTTESEDEKNHYKI